MEYNKKIIWAYINGEEIKNIDELESNYRFMIEVLRMTHDKKMYNLCSEEIKNNHEFIKSIIEIFIDDKKFITTIIDKYLKNTDITEVEYQEIIILICNLTDGTELNIEDDLFKYKLKRAMIYKKEKYNIEWNLKQEEYHIKEELGMGFAYLLYDLYENSEIMLRYFAKKYIEEIFYEQENITLEELVHQHFSTFEKLQEIGIKRYILNYIGLKDKFLAEYLLYNLDLIEKLEKSIKNIGINWYNYNKRTNKSKLLEFEELAEKIFEKYQPSFYLSEAYYYIDNMNLKLPIKLCVASYIEDYIEEIKKYQNSNIININDRNCLRELANLATEIFILSEQHNKIENNPFPLVPILKKEPSKESVISIRKVKRKKQ